MAHTTKAMTSQMNRGSQYSKLQGGNPTRCHRCEGLMLREYCFDLQDETGNNGFWAFRCMQCGEILDPVILQNRYVRHPFVLKARARRKEVIAISTS